MTALMLQLTPFELPQSNAAILPFVTMNTRIPPILPTLSHQSCKNATSMYEGCLHMSHHHVMQTRLFRLLDSSINAKAP